MVRGEARQLGLAALARLQMRRCLPELVAALVAVKQDGKPVVVAFSSLAPHGRES
jgi:hypothetical protein